MFLLFLPPPPQKNEWAANVHWVEETKGPWGSREFQGHLRGGLIETGGLSKLENMMVSVLRKELEYKVEKLKYKKVGGHAPYKDQNQIRTSRVGKWTILSQSTPKFYGRYWLYSLSFISEE